MITSLSQKEEEKGREKGKGKGKEKGRKYEKRRKKMVFGSGKYAKTFLGKKIIFFRGKEYHIFSRCEVIKIWQG